MYRKVEYISIVLFFTFAPIFGYIYFDSFTNIVLSFKTEASKQQLAQASSILETKNTIPQKEIIIPKPLKPIHLFFIGDIMLDRNIRSDGEILGYEKLFACLSDELKGYDDVIGNLEGTVTNYKSVSKGSAYESPESFRFTFDVNAVESLKKLGLSIVSIANNHIRDFGADGINQTIQNLDDLSLIYFGNPQRNNQEWVTKKIGDTTIAYIAYNEFFGTKKQALSDLNEAKKVSDVQIIFAHWGNEYVPVRNDVRNLAHTFVDEGADLVIGSHPHIIQEDEEYNSVPIFYSLGNFIFDQYWEDAVSEGLTVAVTIEDNKITNTIKQKTTSSRHYGTCFDK